MFKQFPKCSPLISQNKLSLKIQLVIRWETNNSLQVYGTRKRRKRTSQAQSSFTMHQVVKAIFHSVMTTPTTDSKPAVSLLTRLKTKIKSPVSNPNNSHLCNKVCSRIYNSNQLLSHQSEFTTHPVEEVKFNFERSDMWLNFESVIQPLIN